MSGGEADDAAMVDAIARALVVTLGKDAVRGRLMICSLAVLAAITPLIRERCAKACDDRVAAHRARMSEYPLDRVACNADALEAGECAAAIRGGG